MHERGNDRRMTGTRAKEKIQPQAAGSRSLTVPNRTEPSRSHLIRQSPCPRSLVQSESLRRRRTFATPQDLKTSSKMLSVGGTYPSFEPMHVDFERIGRRRTEERDGWLRGRLDDVPKEMVGRDGFGC